MKVKVAQSCPTLCDPMDYTVHGILQTRIPGVPSLSLLQGIFATQGSNLGLPHCRRILDQLSHKGSPTKGTAVRLLQVSPLVLLAFRLSGVAVGLPGVKTAPGPRPAC